MASMRSDRMTEFYQWYYGLAIAIGMYEWIAGWMQERWTDAGITLDGCVLVFLCLNIQHDGIVEDRSGYDSYG